MGPEKLPTLRQKLTTVIDQLEQDKTAQEARLAATIDRLMTLRNVRMRLINDDNLLRDVEEVINLLNPYSN